MKADYTIVTKLSNGKEVTLQLKSCDRPTFIIIHKVANDPDPLRLVEAALVNLVVDGDVKSVIEDFTALKACETAIYEMIRVEPAVLKKN
jgi:hypothetical protein